MPTVKTPDERGPLAAWAYESRLALDLSPEGVVHLLGRYDAATIRKAESDSRNMSAPLWRTITALYARLATERRVALAPLPAALSMAAAPAGDTSAIVAAIDRQTVAITALAASMRHAFGVMDARTEERATALAQILARLEVGLLPAETEDEPEHPAKPPARHRTQRKRPAGGPRPSWEQEQEAQSRAS